MSYFSLLIPAHSDMGPYLRIETITFNLYKGSLSEFKKYRNLDANTVFSYLIL